MGREQCLGGGGGGVTSQPGSLGDTSPSGRYDPGTERFPWKLALIESWLGCSRGKGEMEGGTERCVVWPPAQTH